MRLFVDIPVGLDVWRKPTARSEPVGFLREGKRVTVLSVRSGWARLAGRTAGWAPSDFLARRKPIGGFPGGS